MVQTSRCKFFTGWLTLSYFHDTSPSGETKYSANNNDNDDNSSLMSVIVLIQHGPPVVGSICNNPGTDKVSSNVYPSWTLTKLCSTQIAFTKSSAKSRATFNARWSILHYWPLCRTYTRCSVWPCTDGNYKLSCTKSSAYHCKAASNFWKDRTPRHQETHEAVKYLS